MTLRQKRETVNNAIALIIALAAGHGPATQARTEEILSQLKTLEKELYPREGVPEAKTAP